MKQNDRQYHTDQFTEYYEKYHNDIFRFAMIKTKNRSKSLEITQETFMKVWEYIIKGQEIKNERPFLYRIANNLIIDFYRKKKEFLIEDFSDPEYAHHLKSDEREKQENVLDGEKIINLLHKLPKLTREIITLRFISDFSISEIAQTIGRDNKTVSVYLHRGIKQLREIVKDYET